MYGMHYIIWNWILVGIHEVFTEWPRESHCTWLILGYLNTGWRASTSVLGWIKKRKAPCEILMELDSMARRIGRFWVTRVIEYFLEHIFIFVSLVVPNCWGMSEYQGVLLVLLLLALRNGLGMAYLLLKSSSNKRKVNQHAPQGHPGSNLTYWSTQTSLGLCRLSGMRLSLCRDIIVSFPTQRNGALPMMSNPKL
jgi:hypothetical protein